MNMSLEDWVLRFMAERARDECKLTSFPALAAANYNGEPKADKHDIAEAVWGLLARQRIYIDHTGNKDPSYWFIRLTAAGKAAIADEDWNPENVARFLRRLRERPPVVEETVIMYAAEALRCYESECYLASAVMLGVASEAAFLDAAEACAGWLGGKDGEHLAGVLSKPSTRLVARFQEFRKRLEPRKGELPEELGDSMSLTLDSVLDAIRLTRNEAGHPTGKAMVREDQFIALQMFGRCVRRLYEMKAYFEPCTPGDGATKE
jgi:hypothetical protein